MFTKRTAAHGNYYQFASAGYGFTVYHSTRGYFTVYREKRGRQLSPNGKTFWSALDMVAHYKTAAIQLAMIAAEAGFADNQQAKKAETAEKRRWRGVGLR